jgi:hypothetical protein
MMLIDMYSLITSTLLLIPAGEMDGRATYHIVLDNKVIEYSYKEEFRNLVITGKFEYDEKMGDV